MPPVLHSTGCHSKAVLRKCSSKSVLRWQKSKQAKSKDFRDSKYSQKSVHYSIRCNSPSNLSQSYHSSPTLQQSIPQTQSSKNTINVDPNLNHSESSKYDRFVTQLQSTHKISKERIISNDPLRLLAYGADASMYRLVPKVVVEVESEEEVKAVIDIARDMKLGLTFRAAGTSLSGQAVTDSILVRIVPSKWNQKQVIREPDGSVSIKLGPGVIGAAANTVLAKYQKKIGPDPASIGACMIGGIVANNSSGMCCGVHSNSYHTIKELRVVFADGSVLDTASKESVASFVETHRDFIQNVMQLAMNVKRNTELSQRIKKKFSIKNTTGLAINALVDFDDPIEIIKHIIVGSEGTLGFISSVTLQTVEELPNKASSIVFFSDIHTACEAVKKLKTQPVSAVELLDNSCLKSVKDSEFIPGGLDQQVAALLIETRASSKGDLDKNIEVIQNTINQFKTVQPVRFTAIAEEYNKMWDIRKGMYPMVGATRPISTSLIIEDVAVPIEHLANATVDAQNIFKKNGYHEAMIFGHALDGNIHAVFPQSLENEREISRYQSLMDELCHAIATKYGGSLKVNGIIVETHQQAEHGTGRNVAPFVELEWGQEATNLMWQIKELFDPHNILNPDVVLSRTPNIHLKNLKPMPQAHSLIDKCVECGMCEKQCPSRELSLSPRQRIVAFRELQRLKRSGEDPAKLTKMQHDFEYYGVQTCAADGMCATSCPVSIDTGKLIKDLRHSQRSSFSNFVASAVSSNMAILSRATSLGLNIVALLQKTVGDSVLNKLGPITRALSVPSWNPYFPSGAPPLSKDLSAAPSMPLKAVYFSTCVNRIMGPAVTDPESTTLHEKIHQLMKKAGVQVIYPPNINSLCCGLAFESKGFFNQSDQASIKVLDDLMAASNGGQYPILCDASPCYYHLVNFTKQLKTENEQQYNKYKKLNIMEPVTFTLQHLAPRLEFTQQMDSVIFHVPCSSKKAGLELNFKKLASLCAKEVVDSQVPCCGMAGDRGLNYPELIASSLKLLKSNTPPDCKEGFSTSRTCEIGLSLHSNLHYHSILYLVDRASKPKDITKPSN